METKICKKCGRELPVSNFRKGRANGVEFITSICTECISALQKAGRAKNKAEKKKSQQDLVEDAKKMRLSEFTPRELMQELKRRGYEGELTYTEVHKIKLEDID